MASLLILLLMSLLGLLGTLPGVIVRGKLGWGLAASPACFCVVGIAAASIDVQRVASLSDCQASVMGAVILATALPGCLAGLALKFVLARRQSTDQPSGPGLTAAP